MARNTQQLELEKYRQLMKPPEAFADGMSDFMMRALDLSPILGTRRDPDPAKDGHRTA